MCMYVHVRTYVGMYSWEFESGVKTEDLEIYCTCVT